MATQINPTIGYCVSCKAKREMINPINVVMKNGKPGVKGTCPMCYIGMFRMNAYTEREMPKVYPAPVVTQTKAHLDRYMLGTLSAGAAAIAFASYLA